MKIFKMSIIVIGMRYEHVPKIPYTLLYPSRMAIPKNARAIRAPDIMIDIMIDNMIDNMVDNMGQKTKYRVIFNPEAYELDARMKTVDE